LRKGFKTVQAASLEKGDIEAGNSEATPELLVFQWKKKSNKVV
jgi:hypothetical protein